mgnify:CR=1 FL=1
MRVADNSLCPRSQHSSHLLRITGALMSLSLGVTSLAACFPITSTPSTASTPSASSLSTGEAKNVELGEYFSHSGVAPLPTNSGPLSMYDTHNDQTTLVKHNTEGGIVWSSTITPSVADMLLGETTTPQMAAEGQLLESTSGYAVVSPDGRHASLLLRPADMLDPYEAREENRDFTVADQRAYVLVIETETGRTVRTEEVKGLILGQVLTNDTLAVETSQSYYPGGDGHGTITTYSLAKPTAKAATIPTDKWLVGATQDSLLLAPSNMSQGHFGAQPLTRLSESGDVVGTVTGVTDVYRGGWVGRVKDGTDSTDEDTPTELVHLDSGVTTDVAGLKVEEVALPTAAGILVSRETTTGEGQNSKTTSTPQFWLSAADDGHPHTENLEQFSTK